MIIRKIRIEGMVAFVPLTQGYETFIDADDAIFVEGFNWCAMVRKYTVYAVRSTHGRSNRLIRMHRLLMSAPDGMEVDHEDGNGLNNMRSSNLRLATRPQNASNQRIRSDNDSGFKGVSWHKKSNKWVAQIAKHGKISHLGLFSTRECAYKAYCEASACLHGDFGITP